jgi:ProP effector
MTPSDDNTAAAPSAAPAPMNHAACTTLLQQHFPALFGPTSPNRPLKLHIQADIQQRAPGVFTKAALSNFLRRYTASPAYLQALARTPQRHDLDGQPAGEVSDEHRQGARDELLRRRTEHETRRAEEDEARRGRARLLRDFETTTLTRPNFCALKGLDDGLLDVLLAQARQEATQRPPVPLERRNPPPQADRRAPRRPPRGPGGPGGPARP